MRVLHVIPSLSPSRGGPSKAAIEMVSALREADVDAEIVTTDDDGADRMRVETNTQIIWKGVPCRFFRKNGLSIPIIGEYTFSAGFTRWMLVNVRKYDLVHVHALMSYLSTAAMVIARRAGIPYIVRPLGTLREWSLEQRRLKKKLYIDMIESRNLIGATAVHFTALAEQQDAASLGLDLCSFVCPLGITVPEANMAAPQALRARLRISDDTRLLLFLSRLHPVKGFENLADALRLVQCDHDVRLLVAGRGSDSYESELRHRVRAAGMAERVKWLGFVEGEFKELLLQGSDVFVLPSWSENFGIVVLEALAAGLPVLTTPGVALSSLISSRSLGWVCSPNPQAIATELGKVFSRPDEIQAIRAKAADVVREFYSWPKVARKLRTEYASAVSHGK